MAAGAAQGGGRKALLTSHIRVRRSLWRSCHCERYAREADKRVLSEPYKRLAVERAPRAKRADGCRRLSGLRVRPSLVLFGSDRSSTPRALNQPLRTTVKPSHS